MGCVVMIMVALIKIGWLSFGSCRQLQVLAAHTRSGNFGLGLNGCTDGTGSQFVVEESWRQHAIHRIHSLVGLSILVSYGVRQIVSLG